MENKELNQILRILAKIGNFLLNEMKFLPNEKANVQAQNSGPSPEMSQFRLLQQNYHRLGGLNSKHLFPTILESEESKLKGTAELVSGKNPLSGCS